MPDDTTSHYRIEPVDEGFQIIRDGVPWAKHASALCLGALIDALLREADEREAVLIAQSIYKNADPTSTGQAIRFTTEAAERLTPDARQPEKPRVFSTQYILVAITAAAFLVIPILSKRLGGGWVEGFFIAFAVSTAAWVVIAVVVALVRKDD